MSYSCISHCCILATIVEYATFSFISSFVLHTDALCGMMSYVGFVSWFDTAFDRFEIRCQVTPLRIPQQKQRNELKTNVATEDTIIRLRVVAFMVVQGHLPTVVHTTYGWNQWSIITEYDIIIVISLSFTTCCAVRLYCTVWSLIACWKKRGFMMT